ncbi:hypothetical protein Lesp02_46900 [Lentzea sp. NBRC 105346]|uniref:aminotransferase class IV n=1 Tax=Lentzea sp. NBRC 105346 TaxID=3032205 RepID=UPI0024A1B3C0|nr:aminotransferase class IV [Lentzea sp. NBRC 105346]GLZ32502.1 hypothetical protein Lesp02_46900 [Lentzea sp. NBRC 105346]
MREASFADLLINYGHFTSMQVRGGRVQGLALHLARLASATEELYGVSLPDVRPYVLRALGSTADATVRVTIAGVTPSILVTLRPPRDPRGPRRLMSVQHARPFAHIKHVGMFAQIHFGKLAEQAGFDDALLVAPSGAVTETTIANVGFFDGDFVVWPSAPQLNGTTMQLLEPLVPSRREVVSLSDIGRFSGAFVTNSSGVSPVTAIDSHSFEADERRMKELTEAYDSVPWDPI